MSMSRRLTTVRPWIWSAALGLSLLTVSVCATATGATTGAQIEVEVAAGGTQRTELVMRNGCDTARRFLLKKKKPRWLSYSEEGSTIRIGPGQSHAVELTFDASGRKPGTYHGALRLRCTDCNKDRRCHVQQQEIDVRVTVTGAPDLALLARRLEEVEERFEAGRRAAESHTRTSVRYKKARELVARTDRELEQAFEAADRDGQLAPLADWGQERLQQLGRKLSARTGQPERQAGGFASVQAGTPLRAMDSAGTPEGVSGRSLTSLLGTVSCWLKKLIYLVERNDLMVDLVVVSTPDQGASFELFNFGKGEVDEDKVGEDERVVDCFTDDCRARVYRGLYRYRVSRPGNTVINADLDLVDKAPKLHCLLDKVACYSPMLDKGCNGSQQN